MGFTLALLLCFVEDATYAVIPFISLGFLQIRGTRVKAAQVAPPKGELPLQEHRVPGISADVFFYYAPRGTSGRSPFSLLLAFYES